MLNNNTILTNPAQRLKLSISEVMSMLDNYPYCLNLHYLLLEKTKGLEEEKYLQILKKVSTYSIDRQHLKKAIEKLKVVDLEQLNLKTKEEKKSHKIKSTSDPIVTQTVRIVDKKETNLEQEQNIIPTVKEDVSDDAIGKSEKSIEKMPKKSKKKVETDAEATFEEWLSTLSSSSKVKEAKLKSEVKGKKKKKKKKKKSKKNKAEIANNSFKESEDIISETLAEILATQGYDARAIEMYNKLSLLFPEKSSYFAGKIKEIKKS